jgi:hypothetical protein
MEAAIGDEAATRAAADTALQAALNAEATARANGDSAEAAARAAADTYILTYAQGIDRLLHDTISRGAAPLDSPHFTGNPTSPTPAPGDSDTSIATTQFVTAGFAPLVSPFFGGTPAAPNPLAGDNDNSLATTAWVQAEVARFLPYPGSGVTWAAGTGAPTANWPEARSGPRWTAAWVRRSGSARAGGHGWPWAACDANPGRALPAGDRRDGIPLAVALG